MNFLLISSDDIYKKNNYFSKIRREKLITNKENNKRFMVL